MNIYINQNLNCVTHAHFSVAAITPSIKEREERSLQITNSNQKKTYGKSIKKKDRKIAKLEKTLEKERQKRRKQKQQRHREQTSGKLNNENISEKNRDNGFVRDDSSRVLSQSNSTVTQRKHLIYSEAKEKKIHDDLNKQLEEEEIENLRLELLNKQLNEEEIENLRLELLNKQLNEEEKFEKQQANTERDVSFIESEFSRIVSLSSNESSSSVIDVDSDHQRPMLLHEFKRLYSQNESVSWQEELQQLEEEFRYLEESTPEVQSHLFEEHKEQLKKIEERAYRGGYLPRPQKMFASGSSASQYRQYRCNTR